jgi:hypothetical protein
VTGLCRGQEELSKISVPGGGTQISLSSLSAEPVVVEFVSGVGEGYNSNFK